jgi:hypothetical protein
MNGIGLFQTGFADGADAYGAMAFSLAIVTTMNGTERI